MNLPIPLYKPYLGEDEKKAVCSVIDSLKLSRGDETTNFEESFGKYIGKKHAIAVSSGTAGLHLSIKSLNWKEGDEIITTIYSFVATSNALLYENIKPVFVDICTETLNIDTAKIEEKITPKTKGILIVHLSGFPNNYDDILNIAKKYNLHILEDACQAIGKPSDSFPVSYLGSATVYAFFENKQLAIGEGGMVVTDDDEIAFQLRSLRDQGRSSKKNWVEHVQLGYNYRMSEMQAAIGHVQLKKLPMMIQKRQKIAKKYNSAFNEINQIKTLHSDLYDCTYFNYFIILDNNKIRNDVIKYLDSEHINYGLPPPPLHYFAHYKYLKHTNGDFPVAEILHSRMVSLPMFVSMSNEEINRVINCIKSAVNVS